MSNSKKTFFEEMSKKYNLEHQKTQKNLGLNSCSATDKLCVLGQVSFDLSFDLSFEL